jgi:hypothetical protein
MRQGKVNKTRTENIMNRVYRMTKEARNNGMTWDEAIYTGQIETVAEFDSLEEALSYFENELGGDSENYGVE